MKTNLLIIAIVSILVAACTTGTQLTRTYDDDIYFSPKDVPPVSMVQDDASEDKDKTDASNQRIVISQKEKNADGTVTLNNDIYQKDENSDFQVYDLDDQELSESDTTVYYNDDSVKYVINNYYEDEDIDFAYRIHRFHRPYFYDPFFYDDWAFGYYPFYSGYYGGYDPWYAGSWGWGWGYPYSYYYSPFAYGYWGYGGYYNSWYDGYYNGYYNGYYGGGGFYNDHQVARRRSTEMNVPGRSRQDSEIQGRNRTSVLRDGAIGNDSEQKLPAGVRGSNGSKTYVQNGHTRTRTGDASEAKNATIVNNRRAAGESASQVQNGTRTRSQAARPGSTSSTVRRTYEPSTTGRTYDQSRSASQQGKNYTPSYNKPRIANQPNYNNNSYSRSRSSSSGNYDKGVIKSGSTGSQGYSAPRSSSSMRQTYQSRSSYSSGSSGSSGSSYRGSSGRSSGSDYTPSRSYGSGSGSDRSSAPSRSYNSGGSNYNSGSSGGSYGGSSGGGRSGGSSGGSSGGGSGHRR